MKPKVYLPLVLFLMIGLTTVFGQPNQVVSATASPLNYNLSQVLVRIDLNRSGPNPLNSLDQAAERGLIKSHTHFADYGVSLIQLNQSASDWAGVLQELEAVRGKISTLSQVEFASTMPAFQGPAGEFAGLWDRMVVKVVSGEEAAALTELQKWDRGLNQLGTPEPAAWSPNTFNVPLIGTLPEYVWDLAEELTDHPSIEYAYPDFLFSPLVTTNDTFYSFQWALNNTGSAQQYNGTAGADMEIEQAWTISHGDSSLIIAVLDSGVDTLHPDLDGKLLPGYDATPADLHGYPNIDYPQNAHGTACSGIAAAWSENGIGIAGVAPACQVMPVRVFYYVDIPNQGIQPFATSTVFAEGINYAWQNGADVLSNSWGIPDWLLGLLPNQNLIIDAMADCHDSGRNGLGAPMLFSSGNEGDPPIWPGRLADGITVNSTSMCDEWKNSQSCDGENWWAGNWGGNLDFSAPGVKIYTCDMTDTLGYGSGDYTPDFNGTSSACPNAAGVAALVLSIRPDLTTEEVRYILSNTCEKVGGYNYSTVKIAGYWSLRLGYGRINAFQALTLAQTFDSIPAVGITDPLIAAAGLEVYPNPAKDQLTVEWNQSTPGEKTWTVTDLSGKTVVALPARKTVMGRNRIQLNVPLLPAGVYMLRSSGTGVPLVRKIVIQ